MPSYFTDQPRAGPKTFLSAAGTKTQSPLLALLSRIPIAAIVLLDWGFSLGQTASHQVAAEKVRTDGIVMLQSEPLLKARVESDKDLTL